MRDPHREDALSCRSFFAKEPWIIGLFYGKWSIKTIHTERMCASGYPSYILSSRMRKLSYVPLVRANSHIFLWYAQTLIYSSGMRKLSYWDWCTIRLSFREKCEISLFYTHIERDAQYSSLMHNFSYWERTAISLSFLERNAKYLSLMRILRELRNTGWLRLVGALEL